MNSAVQTILKLTETATARENLMKTSEMNELVLRTSSATDGGRHVEGEPADSPDSSKRRLHHRI